MIWAPPESAAPLGIGLSTASPRFAALHSGLSVSIPGAGYAVPAWVCNSDTFECIKNVFF